MNKVGDSSKPVMIVPDKKVSFELPKDDEVVEESYVDRLKKLPLPPPASVKPESVLPPNASSLAP